METAPPDKSTYEDAKAAIKEKEPKEKQGSFSFYEALQGGLE